MIGIMKIVVAMKHNKSKQNIYYGYWSFEAGAIDKNYRKINDTQLSDTQYYPYDMVHYKE